MAVAEHEIELRVADEQGPFTLNHYFMDTYNKIKLDEFSTALAAHGVVEPADSPALKQLTDHVNDHVQASRAVPAAGLQELVKAVGDQMAATAASMKQWYSGAHCIGNKSNETQEAENMQVR